MLLEELRSKHSATGESEILDMAIDISLRKGVKMAGELSARSSASPVLDDS